MNNKISELWHQLTEENIEGIAKRLYNPEIAYHIYATFDSDETSYGVALSYSNDIKADITPFKNLKLLKVSLYNDASFVGSKLLIIELLAPEYKDTFSMLCESLINSVKGLSSEKEVVKKALNQLEKWRALFDKTIIGGMSTSEQQGLYGELSFLEKLLKKNVISTEKAVEFWVGADAAIRDFQGNAWAVEAKTTSTNNPQKVTINGERQLDETLLDELYLYHCSVEISNKNGETLLDKIMGIRMALQDNAFALGKFNEKLLEYGYLDEDQQQYQSRCYKIRRESIYEITKDFPRIKEEDLRNGVGDVNYVIILANCANYIISETKLFNSIKDHE